MVLKPRHKMSVLKFKVGFRTLRGKQPVHGGKVCKMAKQG